MFVAVCDQSTGKANGFNVADLPDCAYIVKLSVDVLPVCAQGGGRKSAMPDKVASEMLARLELRLAQLSGHV